MRRVIKSIAKFLIVWAAMTIASTIVWEYVAGDLYDCADGGIPGYWTPGYWVHSWDSHPVVAVPKVVHDRSMSEPDVIKQGWSTAGLLGVWFSFFAVSSALSILLARVRWFPTQQTYEPVQPAN
jgi:hypothetical protein